MRLPLIVVHVGAGILAMLAGALAIAFRAVKNQSSAGAYFFFRTLASLSAAGDVAMLFRGGLSGKPRIARHVWRMCFGWFIATVSFFMGQQQVFPKWLRGSSILVALAFLPLLFLSFWLIRVRFTDAYQQEWLPRRA